MELNGSSLAPILKNGQQEYSPNYLKISFVSTNPQTQLIVSLSKTSGGIHRSVTIERVEDYDSSYEFGSIYELLHKLHDQFVQLPPAGESLILSPSAR